MTTPESLPQDFWRNLECLATLLDHDRYSRARFESTFANGRSDQRRSTARRSFRSQPLVLAENSHRSRAVLRLESLSQVVSQKPDISCATNMWSDFAVRF